MTLEALLHHGSAVVRERASLVLEVCGDDAQPWGLDRVWLTLAVLTGRLPADADVVRTHRFWQLDGAAVALAPVLDHVSEGPVRVVSGDLVPVPETDLGRALAQHWPGAPVTWDGPALRDADGLVVVPWRARLVLPEPALDPQRASRLGALLQRSGNWGSAVDLGCGALVTGDPATSGAVAAWLSALAHTDRVATPSQAATDQLAGWREMLAGTGLTGPALRAFPLAGFAAPPEVGPTLSEGGVLVVCSDPGADQVLDDLLADGLRFDLGRTLAPGARLLVHAAIDDTVAAPVHRALAAGIPVVTSSFGALRELGKGGGALLVDPRDEQALTAAIRSVLTDENLHRSLVDGARARTWPAFPAVAQQVWDYLVTDA